MTPFSKHLELHRTRDTDTEYKMTANKAIHFSAEDCRVHEIPTLEELTDDEYANSYYSAAEYLWINKRERKLLKRLKMVGDVGPDDDTLGLVSKSQNRERHVFMDCAHNAVFSEQQRQIDEGENDPNEIANLYSRVTEEPCNRSQLRAATLHSELTTVCARHGSRRWSMDMGRRACPPRRPAPKPSLSDNFDFSETLPSCRPAPASVMSPRGRSSKSKVAPMPIHLMQSPNKNRWSQGSSSPKGGLDTMNSTASIGLPRRLRTPQCQERKTLGFAQISHPLAAPVL
eukprot:CAMPEP_0113628200 /NCGR_PEP_ID=MMETSP0017_2-20120614/14611_1 /TAXON_ID=2856 /ORGANISM="Cylindrotheca closterium" /LENGTH=285 /DNA_ID=CAMNT_0000538495 /DNA_START=7 /DNA_END=864 /DNA_ORIENTATION=- /assembly_acc=CAM_ASM_000147